MQKKKIARQSARHIAVVTEVVNFSDLFFAANYMKPQTALSIPQFGNNKQSGAQQTEMKQKHR